MGEKEDREKAEKLAAAKKRVAQLQKKKKKDAAVGVTDKTTSKVKSKARKDEEDGVGDDDVEEQTETRSHTNDNLETAETEERTVAATGALEEVHEDDTARANPEDPDEAAFHDAVRAANTASTGPEDEETVNSKMPEASPTSESPPTSRKHSARQPSVSIQSKIRSTSFRQSTAPLSPSATPEADESVYRKQTLRIEDLEKENKRLAEYEARWRRSEEELEELRETAAENSSRNENQEIDKLREEVATLRRNSRASLSNGAGKTRQSGALGEDLETLKRNIESKESTISDLQLEVSRLRTQVSTQTEGCETHGEQIAALKSSLQRADVAVKKLEAELADTKKALSRASEKAVVDGTEQTSKDTKIKSLERENQQLTTAREEAEKRLAGLDKKVEAMNKLHRETEQRSNTKMTTLEGQAREGLSAKSKIEGLEREVARLREARKRAMSGGGGDDGLDELEDEERKRLEARVRDLEGEVFELRRGVWRDRRKELQPGMAQDEADGDEFDDVDLTGSGAISRRRSTASQNQGQARQQHSGFTQVINSGLAAFRSTTISPDSQQRQQTRPRNDSLLQDFDDDAFDENAFAMAQREEEMRKMVEHVREVKRGLKAWQGWRLDLVDARRGGGGWGIGEVFEV